MSGHICALRRDAYACYHLYYLWYCNRTFYQVKNGSEKRISPYPDLANTRKGVAHRAQWRVTSVLTQAKPWRRRKSLPPSMSNPPGMERHVVAEPKNKRPPLAVFYSVNTTGFVISPPHTARKGACEGGTFAGFPPHVQSPARRRPLLHSKSAAPAKKRHPKGCLFFAGASDGT